MDPSFPDLVGEVLDFDDDEDMMIANVLIQEEQWLTKAEGHDAVVPFQATGSYIVIELELTKDSIKYFAEECVYPPYKFRRRFRMSCTLFCRILNAVEVYDPYFVQQSDALGVLGLSSLQKVTVAFRMLAYGAPTDVLDEYVKIGESTAIESLRHFVKAIVELFSNKYGRSPNNDIAHLLADGEAHGFPGMLGSVDCMHWKWKYCPSVWQGQYSGYKNEPTLILEAIASHDLWIWHYFFGSPRSLNDLNVLDQSPIFTDLTEGCAPAVNYSINGHDYTMGYYLVDGIYPTWSMFVKTISCPQSEKQIFFAKQQESERKNVERAFGALQTRFAIVHGPSRFWDTETLGDIMRACIIMHNMIIEDEGDTNNNEFDSSDTNAPVSVSHVRTSEVEDWLQSHMKIKSNVTHSQLQLDLVEHLWQHRGNT